jgi:hypothetical protein
MIIHDLPHNRELYSRQNPGDAVFIFIREDQQMNVIGHQDIRQQFESVRYAGSLETLYEPFTHHRSREEGLSSVAGKDEFMNVACKIEVLDFLVLHLVI